MPVIEIRGLCKKFERTLAVDHLSFAVDSGTVVGFLGPNGAGKTTTLRSLLGLVEPTGGGATINGIAYRDLSHPLREVGAVLEASQMLAAWTRQTRSHCHAESRRVSSGCEFRS